MRISSVIMLISFTILLFGISFYVGVNYTTQPKEQNTFASITPIVRQIMVMDIDKTGAFNANAVLSGQVPILTIHQSENPNDYSADTLTFLDQVGRLLAFDIYNENRLDDRTPIFPRLELVYLNEGKIARIIPIRELGVRQIFLDKQHLAPEALYPNGPKGYWHVVDTAIMADGSTRDIRVVPVNSSSLPPPPAPAYNSQPAAQNAVG
jgi:hypothetical protein